MDGVLDLLLAKLVLSIVLVFIGLGGTVESLGEVLRRGIVNCHELDVLCRVVDTNPMLLFTGWVHSAAVCRKSTLRLVVRW